MSVQNATGPESAGKSEQGRAHAMAHHMRASTRGPDTAEASTPAGTKTPKAASVTGAVAAWAANPAASGRETQGGSLRPSV